MKWYKYLMLSILLFIFSPIAKANTCSNSEIVKYQELAKNVEFTYDYEETDAGAYFKIKASNLQPGLIIKDVRNNKYYNYSGSEIEMTNFYSQGVSYKFHIYSDNPNCKNQVFYTHYITLPYYNYFYKSELCQGIEEFKYCKKWTKSPSSYEEFEKEIIKYKNSLNKNENNEQQKENNGLFNIIYNFYIKSYYIVLPLIIIVGLIIIWKHNKKQDLF